MTADKGPHIEGHILTMPTQMAGFRRRFLAIDLDQISPEFLCHPLRFEQEISKAKISDLPAPKPMHRFEINCLKDQQVKDSLNQAAAQLFICRVSCGPAIYLAFAFPSASFCAASKGKLRAL